MTGGNHTTVRVAAIQPALRLGEPERNLRRAEDLVRDAAREHAPDMILLPESMTSPNVYAREMREVARPVDGGPYEVLLRLPRELDCFVGGGFHAVRSGDAYGTYVLAEPSGAAHLHDKDIPTAWEHNYYRRGCDDGVFDTSLGPRTAGSGRGRALRAGFAAACACSWAACAGRASPTGCSPARGS